jgi:SulP family sulfate permease
MARPYLFNRMEFSGSLGDLGTLLPLVMGMVMINGMSVTGIFFSIGTFYIIAGIYFGVPVPVQPMKVISGYAIAAGFSSAQVSGSTLLVCLFLFILGLTGAINIIGRMIAKSVIRGIQLSTGILLMTQGVKLILGRTGFQITAGASEPFLIPQSIGGLPVGIMLGLLAGLVTLLLLQSKKFPAASCIIISGLLIGLIWGRPEGGEPLQMGVHLPPMLPFGLPGSADLVAALLVLVLPQMPMTIGNAVIANADLSSQYFGDDAKKLTYKSVTLSMAWANGLAFLVGGIPLCHGAGGLAAHYKFGARTGGSNIIIGTIFLAMALFLGPQALGIIQLLPMSILGVLLIFAGTQLGLSILDISLKNEMFVVLLILGVTLTTNLAWGTGIGVAAAWLLRSKKVGL